MRKPSPLEEKIADDVARILKRFPGSPSDTPITLVIRPRGQANLLFTTDDPESSVAAIRRLTAPGVSVAATNALFATAPQPQPPPPSSIEEARGEGMGILLGVIDMAHSMRPPAGTPASAAMDQWAVMVEKMASDHYGVDWSAFVEKCRQRAFGVTGQETLQ